MKKSRVTCKRFINMQCYTDTDTEHLDCTKCEKFEPLEHIADDSKKVKTYCETCFWWNQTCHNAKSCCYGDEREANNFCGWWEYKNPEANTEPHDTVNHPVYYTHSGIECIDALKAATVGLTGIEAVCTANAIKYLWRWKYKNGVQDIDKAIWYLDRLKKELSENDER